MSDECQHVYRRCCNLEDCRDYICRKCTRAVRDHYCGEGPEINHEPIRIDRIKALCRLLEASGDLTPIGTRQIVAVIENENTKEEN